MRSRSNTSRYAALIAAAALAGLLTGCGSVADSRTLTTSDQHQLGQGPGSRALATARARQLLDSLVLPAGSQRLPSGPLPARLREPLGGMATGADSVDLTRLYRLPVPMADAAAFLTAHPAHGTVLGDTSQGNTGLEVDFTPRRVPAGVFAAGLINSVVPGPGRTSLLRVDAEVTWYPARSAAEDLRASRFRSVVITASGLRTARLSGGQRLIRPLVAMLDSLHALPPIVISCPMALERYHLAFQPATFGQAAAAVTLGGCLSAEMSVGGHPQPTLYDTGALDSLLARMLGLKLA